MDRPNTDIPLLPLEPSLSAQDSVSAHHESSSYRTSREIVNSANPIADASGLTGSLLSPCSAGGNAAALKDESESPQNSVQIVWTWIRRRLPEGWRFGTLVGTILSLCALIGNILVLVIVSSTVETKNGAVSTFTTIREGSCSDIENIQLGIHLVINSVSTLLLGASNYCMQCLSAPTRAEVNSAHQQGRYLDIGVPSLRNLRVIKRGRLACWLLLGMSSLPLHLIYNSTFYMSVTNNSYDIYFASHGFENGEWFDNDMFTDSYPPRGIGRIMTVHRPDGTTFPTKYDDSTYLTRPSTVQQQIQRLSVQTNGSKFEKLENADCIDAYARAPLSDRRTLVLVTSTTPRDNHQLDGSFIVDSNDSLTTQGNCSTSLGLPLIGGHANAGELTPVSCLANSSLYTVMGYRFSLVPDKLPYRSNQAYWICSQASYYHEMDNIPPLCSEGHWQAINSNASQWNVYGFEIDYCISEKLEHGCNLNMAGGLLLVVIAFNAMKVIIMVLIVRKSHDDQLITIGDAAASFIQEPDPTTIGLCLYSRKDLDRSFCGVEKFPTGTPFDPKAKRRATAVSRRRWICVIILALVGLGVVLGLLAWSISDLKTKYGVGDFQSLWDFGLGKLNGATLIEGWMLSASGDAGAISAVLVANTPQALFSMLYMLINGLFTSLSMAAEWSRYANRRNPLRASKQRGNQRSTYFLQVPYRLAIPLMGFSAFLHWILSQSIFFTQIDARDSTGERSQSYDAEKDGPTTCSYSPLGMMITVVAGFTLIVFAVALGWHKLQTGMPVAGSSSLVISAACHSPEGTSALLPVMWGAIPDMAEYREDGVQIGHCAFSNGPVEPPIGGNLYA